MAPRDRADQQATGLDDDTDQPLVEDVHVAMVGDADEVLDALSALDRLATRLEAEAGAAEDGWLPPVEELDEYLTAADQSGTYVLIDEGEYAWFGDEHDAAAAIANGPDTLEEITARYDATAAQAAAELRAGAAGDLDIGSGDGSAADYAAGADRDQGLAAGEDLST